MASSLRTWNTLTAADGLAGNRVLWIHQDRDGYLWFCCHGDGASRYDPSAGSTTDAWTTFTTDDGLASNAVFRVVEDREGMLYFCTNGGGISRYDPRIPGSESGAGSSADTGKDAWTTFTTEDGWKIVVSAQRKARYEEVEQALRVTLDEVCHRIRNNVQLF